MRLSLTERRWRFFLFPALYLSQGLVAGFGTTALVNHFVAAGTPLSVIGGHMAMVGFPWVFQPLLWGPVIDRAVGRAMGRYRFWLVLAIVGAQSCLACLLLLGASPTLGAAGAILLAHSTFASLMDTTTDRMIVDSVPTADLGRMTACTRAGFATGGAVGTALFGELLSRYGIPAAAGTLLVMTSALLGLCIFVRERPGDSLVSLRAEGKRHRWPRIGEVAGGIAALAKRLAGRRIAILLLLCFTVDFSIATIQVPLAARLVGEHGWGPETLSRQQALFAFVGGTLITGLAGLAVDRIGAPRALEAWLVASAFAFAALAAAVSEISGATADFFVLGVTIIFTPIVYVVLIPYAIDLVRGEPSPATLFQFFMAALNLGDVAGAAAAGAVGAALPLVASLLLAASLMIGFRASVRW